MGALFATFLQGKNPRGRLATAIIRAEVPRPLDPQDYILKVRAKTANEDITAALERLTKELGTRTEDAAALAVSQPDDTEQHALYLALHTLYLTTCSVHYPPPPNNKNNTIQLDRVDYSAAHSLFILIAVGIFFF